MKNNRMKKSVLLVMVIILFTSCKNANEKEIIQEQNQELNGGSNKEELVESEEVEVIEEIEYDWEIIAEFDTRDVDKGLLVHNSSFYNDHNGLVIGYNGLVYTTDDSGQTWEKGENTSLCRYGIDVLDEDFMLMVGNGGHNRVSVDQGTTWTAIEDAKLVNALPHKYVFVEDKDKYIIGSSCAIFMTQDGGETFEEKTLPVDNPEIVAMYFKSTKVGYIIDKSGEMFKTIDGCESYESINSPIGPEDIENHKKRAVAAMHFYDEANGLLAYTDATSIMRMLITNDGGETWMEESIPQLTKTTVNISHDGEFVTITSEFGVMVSVLKRR